MLATRGAAVAAIDIDGATAQETAQLITPPAAVKWAGRADVSRANEMTRRHGGRPRPGRAEVMVNNAGILDGYFNVDETDEALWRRVIDIDLTGVFLGSKRALQEMLPRGRGRIVNMASVAGLNGTGGGAAYIAAKHGGWGSPARWPSTRRAASRSTRSARARS
jgi:NAD(P)-dependent dehydrogenase (short-subunit alcohol dehydrogenase family)